MMVMVSAGDLMTLYMGLELQSLALYVVASLRRDSARSTEAGLEVFRAWRAQLWFAALWRIADIRLSRHDAVLRHHPDRTEGHISLACSLALVFIISGLAFKVSAVPFHMWTPDVYEGAPTPVTAFFATAPKIAAMGFLRVFCMTPLVALSAIGASDRFAFACVDVPWCLRSDWPNQHQTSDGLSLHRAYGLSRLWASRRARFWVCKRCSFTWRSM